MVEIPFKCYWCKNTNTVNLDEIKKFGIGADPIFCATCNCVSFPNRIVTENDPVKGSQNWLDCIAYTGELANRPTGTISVDGETKYITADGHVMTRGEFIAKYHNDPAKYIIDRIRMHQRFSSGRNRRF
jgi:hypothetical protein